MGKDIGQIYKHSQSQISTMSIKTFVSSYSEPQTWPALELTTMSVLSVTNKNQNNYVLYYQDTRQNDGTITNNDNKKSCETAKKYSIQTISTPNHHSQRIATTSSSIINLNTPMILPLVGK